MKRSSTLFVFLVAAVTAPLYAQGPLNPGAAPAPTMKSLDQVEARTPIQTLTGDGTNQYVIRTPGSYYLTGNITGVSGKACIGIAAGVEGVSIDLNGFALNGASTAPTGINTSTGQTVAIHHGSISNFTGVGITTNAGGARARLDHIAFVECAGGGASLGQAASVSECTFDACGSATAPGLVTQSGCLVDRCVFHGTAQAGGGIQVDYGSTVSYCVVTGVRGTGIYAAGASVHLDHDNSFANGSDGILVGGSFCVVTECESSDNKVGFAGFHLTGSTNRVDRCTASDDSYGILVDSGATKNTITRNTCTSNNTTNYSVSSGNYPATIIAYNSASGFSCNDPLANTQ